MENTALARLIEMSARNEALEEHLWSVILGELAFFYDMKCKPLVCPFQPTILDLPSFLLARTHEEQMRTINPFYLKRSEGTLLS